MSLTNEDASADTNNNTPALCAVSFYNNTLDYKAIAWQFLKPNFVRGTMFRRNFAMASTEIHLLQMFGPVSVKSI